jgi:hypothetical protein
MYNFFFLMKKLKKKKKEYFEVDFFLEKSEGEKGNCQTPTISFSVGFGIRAILCGVFFYRAVNHRS